MAGGWNTSGSYFESCNCDVACPCVFLSAPTTGDCVALFGWHIEKGKYENVSLDGLNVAAAVHSPGHMTKVKWEFALYLDERASPSQRDALGKVFGGQAGGEPAALAPLIGKVLGVKSAKIEFDGHGKRRSLRIPKVANLEVEAIEGQGGKEVVLHNVPLTVSPNQPIVVAKSKQLSYHDHGFNWDLSDKNAYIMPFSYSGP